MKTEGQLHINVHGFGMECSASSYGCDGHIVVHIVFSHKVENLNEHRCKNIADTLINTQYVKLKKPILILTLYF